METTRQDGESEPRGPRSDRLGPGTRIGSFVVERTLAEGGQGTVHVARQDEPSRLVALKTLRLDVDGDEARQRFRFESEVLGRLHHPGIAQVYGSGTHDDHGAAIPWIAMEFVESARDLVSYCEEHRLPLEARLAAFLDVCAALQHGHDRGVVHRDLKPANVLVDGAGRVKVIDFGVARMTETQAPVQTMAGQVFGTLQYMSPEQTSGDPDSIDVRTDVFALGLVLFEAVTGKPGRDLTGLAITEALERVARAPAPSLRAIRPDLPRELDWIIRKATEAERPARYSSAAALADDVQRLLDHRPVVAGPPSALYRARKFVRRHRLAVGAAVLVFAAAAFGVVQRELGARREAREIARKAGVADFLREMLLEVQPGRGGGDATVADMLDDAAAQIEPAFVDDPTTRARLQLTFAQAYTHLERKERSIPLAEAALATFRNELGDAHAETNLARFVLGVAQAKLDPGAAERVLREALEHFESDPNATPQQMIRTITFLGVALRTQQKYDELATLLDTSLPKFQPGGRFAHADSIYLLDQKVQLANALGRKDEALAGLERVVEERMRRFGPDNPDTIGCTLNLTSLLRDLGQLDRAEALGVANAAASERVYGASHPLTAHQYSVLANIALEREDWAGALRSLERAEAVYAATLGGSHRQTLDAVGTRAQCLTRLGRFDDAAAALDTALGAVRAGTDPSAEAVAHLRQCRALVDVERGATDSARSELAEALAELEAGGVRSGNVHAELTKILAGLNAAEPSGS